MCLGAPAVSSLPTAQQVGSSISDLQKTLEFFFHRSLAVATGHTCLKMGPPLVCNLCLKDTLFRGTAKALKPQVAEAKHLVIRSHH